MSCAIHDHHQDGRLRPWVDPDSPGAGTGLRLLSTPPGVRSSATRSTRPTPSRRPQWGTDGDVSGMPGCRRSQSTILLRLFPGRRSVLCVEAERLTIRLHHKLPLSDRSQNGRFECEWRESKHRTASMSSTAKLQFRCHVLYRSSISLNWVCISASGAAYHHGGHSRREGAVTALSRQPPTRTAPAARCRAGPGAADCPWPSGWPLARAGPAARPQ